MTETDVAGLRGCVEDETRVVTNPQIVQRLSRDFYWYSPILKRQLEDKTAEIVVQPISGKEIVEVLTYCNAHEMAVTARGAGTGNYGQAVPLAGGVVLDLSGMDKISEITSDGIAVCEPGVRLGALEAAAREVGWELRCYPSTVVKASVGGFLGGRVWRDWLSHAWRAAGLRDSESDRSCNYGRSSARGASRGAGGARRASCLGNERHHHKDLAGADSGGGLVTVRGGFRWV